MIKAQDSDYQLSVQQNDLSHEIKSRRLLKMIKEGSSNLKFYSWDFRENYIYITYLKNFRNYFNSHEERKRVKVFTHISKLLRTRNPHQIKSHHQKMMMRHKSIEGIIDFLKMKIIKYIKNNVQFADDIERINQHCQKFFIQQMSSDKNQRKKTIKKNSLISNSEEEKLSQLPISTIKVQEEQRNLFQYYHKNSENLNESPLESIVKVQEMKEAVRI